ncbi:MAG: hypothetical protein M3Q65_15270, partial [Chloroflexota bacterium]|nr:hypothetical protein [Chloroflexota bacterium]
MRSLTIQLAGFALLLAFLAVPAAASGAPAVTISPDAGVPGTTFVLTGTGFAAGTTVLVRTFDARTELLELSTVQVRADGGVQASIATAGYPAGTYTVIVATAEPVEFLARGTFTITGGTGGAVPTASVAGPTAPPSTGGGG